MNEISNIVIIDYLTNADDFAALYVILKDLLEFFPLPNNNFPMNFQIFVPFLLKRHENVYIQSWM